MIADGWSNGPVRDDESKQPPALVPYEDLLGDEKEYDRAAECLLLLQEQNQKSE